jgi:orotate phosphoribosyltransferase
MDELDVLKLLESSQAIRRGHFELSSGRHSDTYVQCAAVLQYSPHAESLGRSLAAEFPGMGIGCVISPALGGVIIGQEVGRALSIRAIFVERDASGRLALRRNFRVQAGERILVVEDVWTTGRSTRETIAVIESIGGVVVAAGAIIDRSGGALDLPVRTEALLRMDAKSYDPDDCPLCRTGDVAMSPGSHFLRS